MLRFYVRVALMFMLLFVVCGAGLIAFGSTQPISPALRGFVEGCEGVEGFCWYGIVSNETRLDTAQEILNGLGYRQTNYHRLVFRNIYSDTFTNQSTLECSMVDMVYADLENSTITLATLGNCSHLYVQDVLQIWGEPQSIRFNPNGGILTFDHNISLAYNGDLQPHSRVTSVFIDNHSDILYNPRFQWQGFLPIWRYCFPLLARLCSSNPQLSG
jgi:hypothetical protein